MLGRSDCSDRQPRHRFLEPIHNVKDEALRLGRGIAATELVASFLESGGASRDRTDDLKLAKLALSQLSYGPNADRGCSWWAEKELNLRPHAYQACALTT